MNILIPDTWLRDYINTPATPEQVAEKLSLCSLSVEKIRQIEGEPVYEIEITPNRGDCLSVRGVAREVVAVLPRFGIAVSFNDGAPLLTSEVGKLDLEVVIQDPSLCPRFTAALVSNIIIKPSPEFIQKRLRQVGARPLNNIIDITNYLMFDLGQPMHAFDYDKIKGQKMGLRESREGEELLTLDGERRVLPAGAIVIEDGEGRLIDLCGIIGGQNSQVDENTKRVLFFVQTYDPLRIRRTTMALGHRTDAAARFEKGIDVAGILPGLHKALGMAQEMAGAKIASRVLDMVNVEEKEITVPLDYAVIDRIVGESLDRGEIVNILESLGLVVFGENAKVPSWRVGDITITEDLAEEIARLYGYFNIKSCLPVGEAVSQVQDKTFYWEDKVKDALKHHVYNEVYTYSATNGDLLEKCGVNVGQALRIQNPLSKDGEYLRPTLIPQLLEVLSDNSHYQLPLKFFEAAAVYLPATQEGNDSRRVDIPVHHSKGILPNECMRLGLIVSSECREQQLFNQVKGDIEDILSEVGLKNMLWRRPKNTSGVYGGGKVAALVIGSQVLGQLGLISPSISSYFDLSVPTIAGEFDLATITSLATDQMSYQPPYKLPAVIEDLSLLVPVEFEVGQVLEVLKEVEVEGVNLSAEIKEIYTGEGVEVGKKSVMLELLYQPLENNLDAKAATSIRESIISALEQNSPISLRRI